MAKAGRKGWIEELNIARRYSDLTPEYFRVLKSHFESEDKSDNRWAAERIEKGLVKMIPQDITSGGDKLFTPQSDEKAKQAIGTYLAGNTGQGGEDGN